MLLAKGSPLFRWISWEQISRWYDLKDDDCLLKIFAGKRKKRKNYNVSTFILSLVSVLNRHVLNRQMLWQGIEVMLRYDIMILCFEKKYKSISFIRLKLCSWLRSPLFRRCWEQITHARWFSWQISARNKRQKKTTTKAFILSLAWV